MIVYLILTLLVVALSIALATFVRVAITKDRQVRAYEEFYASTIDDVEAAIRVFDQLTNRRQLLSDDPDVQNIHRVMEIMHDILIGYINIYDRKQDPSGRREAKKD